MGKKKFIDKKRSVTYNLVFRSTEDADAAPERTLLEAARGEGAAGAGPDVDAAAAAHAAALADRRYPPGHPLAWLEDEERQGEMTDERRRELIELGFPDDGYDYLRHVRTLGHGAASLEGLEAAAPAVEDEDKIVVGRGKVPPAAAAAAAAAEPGAGGPSVFVKATAVQQPEVDVAVFDAGALTVLQAAAVEEEAAGAIGGVTAFARRREAEALGAERRDIEELEAMMEALEADDDIEALEAEAAAAGEGVGVPENVPGRVLGEGDLLDDFILSATQGAGGDEASEGVSEVESYEEEWSDVGSDEEGSVPEGVPLGGKVPPRPGSIASTYWRDERTDRKNLLGVIDERFEHLALEYDEDEIGSMEDAAEAGEIEGFADVADFDALLDEFLEERRAVRAAAAPEGDGGGQDGLGEKSEGERPKGRPRGESILRKHLEAAGFDDADAEVAIAAAREAVRRAEAEEAEGCEDRGDFVPVAREVDPTAGWDCETVLSLRSNLYNHPGTITEPGRQRPGAIRLDKRGMPMGVLAPRGLVRGVGEEAAAEEEELGGKEEKKGVAVPERKKGESAEEKKARKAMVKEAKRDARVAKKELKTMYKEEAVKAARRVATAQVQPSVLL